MNLRHLYFIIIIFASLLFEGCNGTDGNVKSENNCGEVKKLTGERKNLNVSIFLDLSDRISPTLKPDAAMEHWKKDLGYIKSIAESFETHLRNKKAVLINDNLKLFMHPLPENIDSLDSVLKLLNKEFTKDNATLDNICSISNDYYDYTSSFYQKTLEQKEPSAQNGIDDYPGSDIYDFFKSKAKDYCIKENHRNILFILTDGYMYMSGTNFKNSFNKSNYLLSSHLTRWGFNSDNYQSKIENEGYGFDVPVTGLDNLEIFVIGFVPERSWELDVLNSYWSTWLKKMGVKNFQDDNWNRYLKQADLPSEIDNLIQDFMYN
ncbi:MAG TPA: hypothetical protein VFC92_10350 [Bacteroidales bacterium]|nr:hypothetical protein [Bacteroidales bacterium]